MFLKSEQALQISKFKNSIYTIVKLKKKKVNELACRESTKSIYR